MKQIIVYAEDDFIKVLDNFRDFVWDKNLDDWKCLKLITRYLVHEFKKNKKLWK